MSQLFQLGLFLATDFISPDEEQAILASIPRPEATDTKERNSIFRYGRKHIYTNAFVSKVIPEPIQAVANRLVEKGLLDAVPTCVTVNQFHKGQIIKPHFDDPKCGPVITVLSLLSTATMRFHKGDETLPVELPPRSLVQMRGDTRSIWQHSIDSVAEERYSVVFRL